MIQDATLKIIDALLTLIFRLRLWPCCFLFCPYRLPIRWLWVNAIAQPLDYTRCNIENCWRSVDALLMLCWCSVDALLTLCWLCVGALLTLCWCSVDALLTLCWRSFLGVAISTLTIVPIKEANTSIMCKSRSIALGSYKMQHLQLLTLCWRSFSERGCDHFTFCFAKKGCQYIDYG